MGIECPHGVLVVSGHEHHRRRRVAQSIEQAKAVDARHRDVEEEEIRHVRPHGLERGLRIGELAQYRDVWLAPESQTHAFARRRFIIDDHDAQLAFHAKLAGRSSVATVPPLVVAISSDAPPP